MSESDEQARALLFRQQTVARAAAAVGREKQLQGSMSALNALHQEWQPIRLAQLERAAGGPDPCEESDS